MCGFTGSSFSLICMMLPRFSLYRGFLAWNYYVKTDKQAYLHGDDCWSREDIINCLSSFKCQPVIVNTQEVEIPHQQRQPRLEYGGQLAHVAQAVGCCLQMHSLLI